LVDLEDRQRELDRECEKLRKAELDLAGRIRILGRLIGNLERLAAMGGRLATVRRSIAERLGSRADRLPSSLARNRLHREGSEGRAKLLSIVLQHLRPRGSLN